MSFEDDSSQSENHIAGVSFNPFTGKEVKRWSALTPSEIDARIEQCHKAQQHWRRVRAEERMEVLLRLGALLEERKEEYARRMAEEMGKPVVEGEGEVSKCAWLCRYYAENGVEWLKEVSVETEMRSYTRLEPLGIVLAIMPWNFPFWQVFRASVPALLVGNGMLLKHAGNVPECAMAIEELWSRAGVPDGLFLNLMIQGKQTEQVIADSRVQGVTLTGSTETGKIVATEAGKYLKKCVFELGGSDPYVVMADADVDLAASECVKGRMVNGGQSCIAAKRWIVDERVVHEFEARVSVLLREYTCGDPLDRRTRLGPLARKDLQTQLHEQVKKSVGQGAVLLRGGVLEGEVFPNRDGFFYPATLLTQVRPGMAVFNEETFGPVSVICPYNTLEEAAALANQTPYGLGAAVFSENIAFAESWAKEHLEAGALFINAFVRSDPRLPFGGVKESGYGRELGKAALYEFANLQSIVMG